MASELMTRSHRGPRQRAGFHKSLNTENSILPHCTHMGIQGYWVINRTVSVVHRLLIGCSIEVEFLVLRVVLLFKILVYTLYCAITEGR
jgi:hypothetical protein